MQTRRIGTVDVSAIGLGEMPMSVTGRKSEDESIQTIHAALDAGVNLIDTADAYCLNGSEFGHGEELVAKALKSYGDGAAGVLVATKGGHTRTASGDWTVDSSADYLRSACEASLRRLGVDVIDLYQHHRPDPKVPYEDAIGTVKELYDAGKVKMVGISNATVDQIKAAQEILGDALVSVQNQFAPNFRSSEDELEYTASQGLAFLPWSPLGGIGKAGDLGSSYAAFATVAKDHDVSPQQVALAWELAKAPQVIPIPGSSRPATIADSVKAVELTLSADELASLDG
jgi:aryl-alcohol dehydrogenase-like predicted oxidoreductase